SGYLYYVSLKGITGSSKLDTADVKERIEHIRQHVPVPICVGFGIRTAEDAAVISSTADGSIVGTVLVSQIEALVNDTAKIPEALQSILRPMRGAMDANA
ncbi:MAG: tryptophan synthase subunit alpha, partial [Litorivicinaceae bacterium]